jgi:hypothetical protein
MSKKPADKPTGRPVDDEKGNRVWKWGSGEQEVETATVRALGAELGLDSSTADTRGQGSNPYNQASAVPNTDNTQKRRSLDDMRVLSEKIKKSKNWTREE